MWVQPLFGVLMDGHMRPASVNTDAGDCDVQKEMRQRLRRSPYDLSQAKAIRSAIERSTSLKRISLLPSASITMIAHLPPIRSSICIITRHPSCRD